MKKLIIAIAFLFALPVFGQGEPTKKVAILETVDKENTISYGVKLMVRSKLAYAVTCTPGYEGYDRVDIASIMGEQEFQRTGMVNDDQIRRLGEMTGADYILIPEVAKLADTHIIIVSKILNVETARLEKTSSIQTATDVDAMDKSCLELASRLFDVSLNVASAPKAQVPVKTDTSKGELTIDGNKYVGEIINGKPHGKGKMTYLSDDYNWLYYEGEWVDGEPEGEGTVVYKNGNRYEGSLKNGNLDGKGTFYLANGNREEGFYIDGVQNGPATFYFVDGDYEKHAYKDDNREGPYTYMFADGRKRVGTYVNDKKEGSATFYFKDGEYAKMNYAADKLNGAVEYYKPNGYKYKTEIYVNGELKKTKNHYHIKYNPPPQAPVYNPQAPGFNFNLKL